MYSSSQEVRNNSAIGDGALALANSVENVESTFHVVVDVQNGGDVTTSVTIVGSGPHGDEVGVLEPVLEAIHNKLMSTSNQVNVVNVVELRGNLGSKKPSSTTRRQSPGLDVLRVGPHQVAEGTLVRDLHSSLEKSDLVKSFYIGRQSTVNTEDLALNNGSDSEVIENFAAVLPRVRVSVLSDSLIVETVHGGDLSGLVVTTEKSNASGVLKFKAEQELESFDGVVTTINEIAHKDVASVGDLAALVEKFKKIMELTMDVTADSDRGAHRLHIAFFNKDFLDLFAKDSKVTLRENATFLYGSKPRVNVRFATHFVVFKFVLVLRIDYN